MRTVIKSIFHFFIIFSKILWHSSSKITHRRCIIRPRYQTYHFKFISLVRERRKKLWGEKIKIKHKRKFKWVNRDDDFINSKTRLFRNISCFYVHRVKLVSSKAIIDNETRVNNPLTLTLCLFKHVRNRVFLRGSIQWKKCQGGSGN